MKVVENGATGGSGEPGDWTLTGSGPTPITGVTGDASITNAQVKVGSYDLSEAGTAVGYEAGTWSCDGGVLAGSTITLAEGEKVSCTIINTALAPTWTVSKSSTPASGSTVLPGTTVTYTITATHTGGVYPTDLLITDDLADVLDNATLQGEPNPSVGTATLGAASSTLDWQIDTLTGTATLEYTVLINDDAFDETLHNVVTPPVGSSCEGSCETTHVTPGWRLTKTSDPASGSIVDPSSTITYTLHALNTSDATVTGATALDDLSDVLDEANLVQPLSRV
nr:hypothetical protein [Leucobacter insecticola]